MHQPYACLGAVVALYSAAAAAFHLATWPSVTALPPRMARFGQDAGKYPVACGLDVRQL
jgi:hypothetical protein